MHNITIPQMAATVRHIAIGENEPCMFWGEPGCGKTEGITQVTKEEDADLVDIRLGQYDSVDLRGFPGVDPISNTTVWHMPSTLPFIGNPRFNPERKKLIFLDEINAAKPATAGVAYQLVQEGRVGEHVLQDNTFIVAAGNREKDRGVTNKMPMPLANRFTHYEVGPDAESWCFWAASQPRIPGEVLAFLQFRQPLISNFNPELTEKAFATPRSWEKAAHYFDNQTAPEDIKAASIEGAIGVAAAAEFLGFCKVIKDMPSIKDIEKDPEGTPLSERAEVRYAVAVGISGAMAATNSAKLNTYLKRMDPDFAVLAWQLAIRRNRELVGCREFIDMARLYKSVFAYAR